MARTYKVRAIELVVIGPIGSYAGTYIAQFMDWFYNIGGFVAAALLGGTRSLLTMMGMHYALAPLQIQQIAETGVSTLLVSALTANFAQGGAAFGSFLAIKDKQMKSVAGSAALSAVLGITEPAMYGVNLKYKRPFAFGLVASATETQKGTAGDITLALNNIKNEMFSRDVSAKVKCTNEIQRRNKQFAGRVPYGYRTGSTKHDIVVDPEAAEVVKKIFYLAAEKGLKNSQIAAELNKEGIISPSMYKAQKWGYKGKVQTFWTMNSVYHIIINRIYTGCFWMYQGHLNGVGSKSTTTIRREERELIRDTHEAIVPESVYIEAQKVMSHPVKRGQGKNKRLSPPPPVPMLARYLKCGCCRNKLFREHTYGGDYICRSAKVRSDGDCEQVRCDAVALETVVFHSIQRLVELTEQEQQQAQEQHRANEAAAADIKNKIRSLSGKRKGINDRKMKLYERFKAGKLTMEEFRVQKAEKAREDEAITSQMEELSAELTRLNADREQPMESKPSVSMEIGDRLTPELLKAFVEKVIIAPNGEPEIVFQFKDTFQ